MLADIPLEADIVWEETFGPVLAIVKVPDLEAALEVPNRSRYGLDSAVFTSNLDAAWPQDSCRALSHSSGLEQVFESRVIVLELPLGLAGNQRFGDLEKATGLSLGSDRQPCRSVDRLEDVTDTELNRT